MHGMASHRSSLKVKATKDYAAVYSDEITFEKGDIFELIQKHSDDWWTGSIHNRVGVFPATHVKVLGPDSGQTGITGISQVLARKWREKTRRKECDSDSPPRPPPRSRRPVPSPPKLRFRPPPPPPPRDYQRIRSAPASSRLDDVYIPISRVQEDTFSRSRDEDIYIPISRAQASSTVSRPRDSSPISLDQEDEVYAPISRARESSARESRSHHSREDLEDGDDDVPEDGNVQGAAALTVTKSDDFDETDDDDEEENDDTQREETGNNSLEMLLTQIDSLNDKIMKEQDNLERECTALDGRHAREVAEMKERHRSEKNKIETSGKIKIRDLKKLLEGLTTQVEKAGRWSREVDREDTSLSQELECPVCLVEMRPPTRIWQCGSGHTLCEGCKNRKEVTRCPTCRRGFTGRAIAMERLISTVFSQR